MKPDFATLGFNLLNEWTSTKWHCLILDTNFYTTNHVVISSLLHKLTSLINCYLPMVCNRKPRTQEKQRLRIFMMYPYSYFKRTNISFTHFNYLHFHA